MAPPPPHELIKDAVEEILLRIEPDEPAHLVRAAAVCKLWRRILSDADFHSRYRRFHRTPPPLGLFDVRRGPEITTKFIPTTAASPFSASDGGLLPWRALDCRHGRVLLQETRADNNLLVVWDPISGEHQELRKPETRMCPDSFFVLCGAAAGGCDHCDCHGGPFLVVCVGIDDDRHQALAVVYSSEACAWGSSVHSDIGVMGGWGSVLQSHSVIGDAVYVHFRFVWPRDKILRYDLGGHCLSTIDLPPHLYRRRRQGMRSFVLMRSEAGLLGIACTRGSCLYLWSRMVNALGDVEWRQQREIQLQTLLPVGSPKIRSADVLVFSEAVNAIFVDIEDVETSIIVDLKSGFARKVISGLLFFSHPVVPS